MSNNKTLRRFQRSLARHGLQFFSWVLTWMPFAAVKLITLILVWIAYQLVIRQRRIAYESLTIAFGNQKSRKEIKEITKKCFSNFGQGMVEMSYYLSHPELVSYMVYMEGKEHLDHALKQGKGVIAVTAHFGNFPLMMLYCCLQGYKASCIIRPTRDEKMEEYLLERRTSAGLKTIYATPRKQCVDQSLEVLKNNEILFVPLDQNFGSDGSVFVEFFGHQAATATGPIVFARRTGAPILPVFITRQENGLHKIMIEPSFDLEIYPDHQQTLLVNTAKITKIIEGYVRRYPYEWGWMHRRWKTQPQNKDTLPQGVN